MFCYRRILLLVIIQLLVLLLKQGNGQNEHLPNDTIVPFHVYDQERMVEFPSIPALQGVSLRVYTIDYESNIIYMDLGDPEGCLPRLFLQRRLYNSSIFPSDFYDMTEDNVTFFNCSSLGSKYLRNEDFSNPYAQDMFACPIYAVSSNDSILKWDVTFCTKMVQLVSPIPARCLQINRLSCKLRQPKSEVKKHKTSKIPEIVLPGSILLVVVCIAGFYIIRYFKDRGEDQVRLEKFLEDYKDKEKQIKRSYSIRF